MPKKTFSTTVNEFPVKLVCTGDRWELSKKTRGSIPQFRKHLQQTPLTDVVAKHFKTTFGRYFDNDASFGLDKLQHFEQRLLMELISTERYFHLLCFTDPAPCHGGKDDDTRSQMMKFIAVMDIANVLLPDDIVARVRAKFAEIDPDEGLNAVQALDTGVPVVNKRGRPVPSDAGDDAALITIDFAATHD